MRLPLKRIKIDWLLFVYDSIIYYTTRIIITFYIYIIDSCLIYIYTITLYCIIQRHAWSCLITINHTDVHCYCVISDIYWIFYSVNMVYGYLCLLVHVQIRFWLHSYFTNYIDSFKECYYWNYSIVAIIMEAVDGSEHCVHYIFVKYAKLSV